MNRRVAQSSSIALGLAVSQAGLMPEQQFLKLKVYRTPIQVIYLVIDMSNSGPGVKIQKCGWPGIGMDR